MSTESQSQKQDRKQQLKRRNWAMFAALWVFVAILFALTLVKIGVGQ